MLTLSEIKGVGEATLKKLKELDIRSVFELFSFLPSKYVDLASPISAKCAPMGQTVLLEGEVFDVSSVSPRGKRSFRVIFKDIVAADGSIFKVTFFNQPYLHDNFKEGDRYRLLAKRAQEGAVLEVVNPKLEKLDKLHTLGGGIYTVYPLGDTIGQSAFKKIMYAALDSVKNANYAGALGPVNADIAHCFEKLHRPTTLDEQQDALAKLASIDVAIALAIYKKLSNNSSECRKVFYKTEKFRIVDFQNALNFTLTPSQIAAMEDILDSLSKNECMSRIIAGDVGSGKTVVAFFALYLASISGKQAALMVPTEILARQHARAFEDIAKKLGISYATLTSSTQKTERESILRGLRSGDISCVIGTQSLIGEDVQYKNLSLIVIDEQHKFGVNERKSLENKGAADILSMTATPIPRSMALTFYEDLDISYIQKRVDAKTNVTTVISRDTDDVLRDIATACKRGEQAFIVCPAIADAEGYELTSIESFSREYGKYFEGISVAELHGKLSADEKQRAISNFSAGKISILIATSVVEVGIDTRANIILIMNADRFGLASLHQLRGRVGRDGSPAICYLQTYSASEKAMTRLDALTKSNDGQYLAEVDFELRGGGDFIGTRQSGTELTPLFGFRINSRALSDAKIYCEKNLSKLSLGELLALTRRGERRVREFIDEIKKVTLNS